MTVLLVGSMLLATGAGVAATASTTTVVLPLAQATYGQQLGAVVRVSAAGVPTDGTVTLKDGASTITTGPLRNGVADLVLPGDLPAATYALTAYYSGSPAAAPSHGTVRVEVRPAAPTVELGVPATGALSGDPVGVTVSVRGPGGDGAGPAGTVTAVVDGTDRASAAVGGSDATLRIPALPAGRHTVTARYSGNANVAAGASAATAVLVRQSSTTAVELPSGPATFGRPLPVVIRVAAGAMTPSGTVTLNVGGRPVGSGQLSGGSVTVQLPDTLAVAQHSLTAEYAGSETVGPSNATAAVEIGKATPALSVTAPAGGVTDGSAATLAVTVTGSGPGATGKVEAIVDGAPGASVAPATSASLTAGAATLTLPSLAPGRHSVVVHYAGDVNFTRADAAPVAIIVPQESTTTIALGAPARYGQSLPVTVRVSAGAVAGAAGETSTGTVVLSDGAAALASGELADGAVTVKVPGTLGVGAHTLTVRYAGSAVLLPSQASAALTVAKTPGVVRVSLASTIVRTTDAPRVSVTVSTPGAAVPTGAVSVFLDGSASVTATLTGGKTVVTLPAQAAGSHRIAVRYGGDDHVTAADAAAASFNVTDQRAPTGTPANNPCPPSARACVDLTHSKTWLQSGGQIVYGPVSMSSGRPGHRTDSGTFAVYWKDKNHRSSIFNDAPMPNSIFFLGGEAFHQGDPGVPSHGCVHLSSGASSTYWNFLNVGDQVFVFGYAPY